MAFRKKYLIWNLEHKQESLSWRGSGMDKNRENYSKMEEPVQRQEFVKENKMLSSVPG